MARLIIFGLVGCDGDTSSDGLHSLQWISEAQPMKMHGCRGRQMTADLRGSTSEYWSSHWNCNGGWDCNRHFRNFWETDSVLSRKSGLETFANGTRRVCAKETCPDVRRRRACAERRASVAGPLWQPATGTERTVPCCTVLL